MNLIVNILFILFAINVYPQENKYQELNHKACDTCFISLNKFDHDISFDFRYSTSNNFLKEAVYDCVDCVLRKEVIEALIRVNKNLQVKGYRLCLFDCYRPLDIQKKMWDIYPNSKYVANPYKNGSKHNRGGAVDLTIETLNGEELDMGTDFDYFGVEAHTYFNELSEKVLNNRKVLRDAMLKEGFSTINSEWWHFNFNNSKNYELSNFKFDCP